MKILGKIYIFFILTSLLFGAVASLDKNHIIKGESVTLKISASGEKAVFPKIFKIGEFPIDSVSKSQSEIEKEGKIYRFVSKYYTFTPFKDIKIPSFTVMVDGKKEKTKPIWVKVKDVENRDFDLEMYADKKEAFVGEPIKISIVFRRRIGKSIQDIKFYPPSFENFWAKKLISTPKEIVGSFVSQTLQYAIFPQKSGTLEIKPASLDIAALKRDKEGYSYITKWTKIVSNSLKIDVKPLGDNLKIYGKFNLSVKVDKKEIPSNTPVTLKIKIKGEGNIDDIDDFSLKIPKATVYKTSPKIVANYRDGKYEGFFSQNFTIVSKKSFMIPSLEFSYFDKDKKRRVTLKSDPVFIKVIGEAKDRKVKVIKADKAKEEEVDMKKVIIISLFTFIVGVLIGFLIKQSWRKPKKRLSSIQKRIKNAKDDKELLQVLLPFLGRSKEIEEIVLALESNVYNNGGYKIDKKQLIKKIDSYLKGEEKKEEFEELI